MNDCRRSGLKLNESGKLNQCLTNLTNNMNVSLASLMKSARKFILTVTVYVVCVFSLFGDAQTIIKQRAKDLRDSVSTPQTSPQNAPQRPASQIQSQQVQPVKLSPAQESAVKKLYDELQKTKSEPSTSIQSVQKSIAAVINSANPPPKELIETLASTLTEIWQKQSMTEETALQVLRHISLVLNGSNLSTQSMNALIYNIEKQVSNSGTDKEAVNKLVQVLKNIAVKVRSQ